MDTCTDCFFLLVFFRTPAVLQLHIYCYDLSFTILTVFPWHVSHFQYQHAETARIPQPGDPERSPPGSVALWELRVYYGINISCAAWRVCKVMNSFPSRQCLCIHSLFLLDKKKKKGKSKFVEKQKLRVTHQIEERKAELLLESLHPHSCLPVNPFGSRLLVCFCCFFYTFDNDLNILW